MSNRRDPYFFTLPNDGQADGIGTVPPIAYLRNIAIQIDGTFVADISLEVQLVPALSFVELATTSAPTLLTIPNDAPVHQIRLVVSNYVSGQIVAALVGRTARD